MGRPPSIPAEKKSRIVLSVLAGEMTIAEAARREKVSEQSISRWKAEFLEAGKAARGHVFNLGHGVPRYSPVDHVKAMVDSVHELSQARMA